MNWNDRISAILKSVSRRAVFYCLLGLGLYVPGSVALLVFIPDKAAATLCVMMYFQALAIVFTTIVMYPCIGGAFKVGLEANRDMFSALERLQRIAESGDHPTVRKLEDVALQVAADMKAVRVAIEERTKPVPVRRRPDSGSSNGEESPAEEVTLR